MVFDFGWRNFQHTLYVVQMKWVKTGERVVFYGMTSKKIKQKLEREP
jgi:hypothetical protein